MAYGNYNYIHSVMSNSEKEKLKWLEDRRSEMDTSYRKELIQSAEWGRAEYDSIPQERVGNLDLFKIGLSRAVVHHRLSMMFDNPSETVYKSVEDSDDFKVAKLRELDKYDKNIGRFASVKQDLDQTAEVEGTAIATVRWSEDIKDGITKGKFCTLTEKIPLKDFWWDPAGIFLNGYSAYTCNDAAYRKVYSIGEFRRKYDKKPYKNVKAVIPNAEFMGDEIYKEDWETGRDENSGDYVHVWTYKTKNHDPEGGIDKEFVVANGRLIYDGEMREPEIQGEKWLPFCKLVGIQTGGFGGLGIPALIRHPVEALERMVTMAEAQAELAISPVLFYNSTGEFLPEEIEYYPGAAYPYKGTGEGIQRDIQFMSHQDITQGAQYTIDKMIEFVTIITGVDVSALIESGELAIQTQNKREVQEKILKMSVIWNETHGLYDLAALRLAYMQKYYPSMRTQRILGKNGQWTTDTDFPKIPVEGFKVSEASGKNGQTINKLVKAPGAYSEMSLTPEDLQFNVDVIIESSQMASGADTVRQNKFDKVMAEALQSPSEAELFDWTKVAKQRIQMAGFKDINLLRDEVQSASNEHPARKEFKAILVSETIPFDPVPSDSYVPEEYLFVFRNMMKLPEYKKSSAKVKMLATERLTEHSKNFMDPYFKDRKVMAEQAVESEQIDRQHELAGNLEPPEEEAQDLAGRASSTSNKIGAATREANKTGIRREKPAE